MMRLARDVDRPSRPAGTATVALADRRDAVALDHHHAVLDHLVALHRDDARAGQRQRCRRHVVRRVEADVRAPARRLGSFSGAPSTNAKASFSSRVKSSGPSAQCRRFESPDQCRYSPASLRHPRHRQRLAVFGPTSIVLPGAANGVDERVEASRGRPATARRARPGTRCASTLRRCVRSSLPSRSMLTQRALVLRPRTRVR